MTKLLYIPSGEIILFLKTQETGNSKLFWTPIYEQSIWFSVWDTKLEEVINEFCRRGSELSTKRRHNIPTDTELCYNEFEFIYD